jgi:glycosyltransferase involved in cell wall biosynthesis
MANSELTSAAPRVPLVSVSITTYNLATLLPRALDSVLAQRTTFPIEIVIGDDCSEDATVSVAHAYQERHPDIIRVLERGARSGIQRNTYETIDQCRGKFIAWLDADDYWTDPEKLAIQVQTLESDPSINVCGHFVRYVTNDGEVKRERYPSISAGRYGLEELLRHNFLPTPSVMFRNGIQRQIPPWYFDLESLSDWPFWVLAALSGDIVLLDGVMADYRLSPNSSMTSKGPLFWYRMDTEFYEHVEDVLPSKWHKLVRAEKGKRYESMAYTLRKQGNFRAARTAAFKAFSSPSPMDNCDTKTKALLASVVREMQWRLSNRLSASDQQRAFSSAEDKRGKSASW